MRAIREKLYLYKDLDAGVFGDQVIKAIPSKPLPEPLSLVTVMSTDKADLTPVDSETLPPLPHVRTDDSRIELPANSYSIQDAKLKSEEVFSL